ncbi:MAG: ROK family protein, partial [Carbonactinosporaceae bacterium]
MSPASTVSAGHLLQLVRWGRARTRKELGEVTGLARSTVAQRVDQLVAAGYLRESGPEVSTGGRPPTGLTFDESRYVVLVGDLGPSRGRLAVMDLGGRSLAETAEGAFAIGEGPDTVLVRARHRLHELLTEAGRSPDEVCGVAIGVPGPVEFDAGRVTQPPIMPGWHDFPIRESFAEAFPVPILVDNDANLMALGEYVENWRYCPSVLLVTVGEGIGAGIVIGGDIYRGVDGAAGDIGHVRLYGHEAALCACGATGCLAAVASGAA